VKEARKIFALIVTFRKSYETQQILTVLPTRLNALSTTVEGLVVYCLEFLYGNC
jgi:hypothetical protein